MINLLPPEIKSEIAYSRYNTSLIKLMGLILIAGSVLLITLYLGSRNQHARLESLQSQRQQRKTDSELEKTLLAVAKKVKAITALNASNHRYSVFLKGLAGALPDNAAIDALTLSSDAKPLKLTVNMANSDAASSMKEALSRVAGVQTVEIESLNQSETGFTAIVNVTLKPEAFK